jgi:hypothetical protein
MPVGSGRAPDKQAPLSPLVHFVSAIQSVLGDSYSYGAEGPSSFDCSGLVQWAAGQAGIKGVPRTSEAQWNWVNKIQLADLQPGDLVFSQWPGDNASPGHVQVYVGNGNVIGADNPGVGVEQTPLSNSAGHIIGYGRMPGQAAGGAGTGGGLSGVISGIGGALGFGAGGSGLLGLALPQPVLDMFTGLEKIAQGLAWFINPENWARMLSGGIGVILAVFGLVFLVRAGM